MDNRPIGIYDSGVGAVAVLRTAQSILPNEKFLLFADFENAPYGEKTKDEILELAKRGVRTLTDKHAKAVVVACNTATSAAIDELRREYSMPIIGMEPAIKPAAHKIEKGKVLVLATPATLKFTKFKKLYASLDDENIVPVACPDLSKLIEDKKPGSKYIKKYLKDIISPFDKKDISAVVIGCTHFSFIAEDIKEAAQCNAVFDGRYGTARHLQKTIEKENLLGSNRGGAEFVLSAKDEIYRRMIEDFYAMKLSFEE